MQQLSAKVFKLSFKYLHIYSPKVAIFCRKKAKLHHYCLVKGHIYGKQPELDPLFNFLTTLL